MTSVPQQNAPNRPKPASQTDTIIRIVLFAILGYMIFALAYDYLYVFKTHEAKFQELTKLVEQETSRSADDRKEKGPTGPKQVQEVMGFAPSVPLEDKGHYSHERYTYRRGLLVLTRDIDVFYKKYHGDTEPGIYSVAHTKEDLESATPAGAVQPNEDAATEPTTDDKKGETKTDDKKTDETTTEPAPEETKTDEKKAEAPAEEKSDAPAEEKKADETKE